MGKGLEVKPAAELEARLRSAARTCLLAHEEAGSHSQPVGKVVYGVGQQVEIATDLGWGET